MTPTSVLVFLVMALIVVYIYSRDSIEAWRRYRQVRLVRCPETGTTAAVQIDTAHAMATAFMESAADVRLRTCSRWPERGGECRQPCIPNVLAVGDGGRAETIVDRWYSTQTCCYCGKNIRHAATHHPPAFADAEGATVEWTHVDPERLPKMIATRRAVCWNCHIAETLRRTYPDLPVDRSAH